MYPLKIALSKANYTDTEIAKILVLAIISVIQNSPKCVLAKS